MDTHKDKDKDVSAKTQTVKRPQWWTKENDASWGRSRASILADWHKVKDDAKHLGDQIADKALAFGHEARARFADMSTWNDELQHKLAEDWKQTQSDAGEGWAQVHSAVKLGWERAKTAVKS